MKFIADENIPIKVIEKLRRKNVEIKSIIEIEKGITDEEIVKISMREKAIIITFDKDFGRISFTESEKPFGVIVLRILPKSVDYIYHYLKWLIIESKITFENKLIVAREKSVKEIKLI